MPSHAEASFRSALGDVENLLKFHRNEGGNAPGRRSADLASLNKSAVVLLCAAWESYIEFVIRECADRNVDVAARPEEMHKCLRRLVSSHVRAGKDESAWQLAAGEGWRELTKAVVRARVGTLNTPKKGQISELMHAILGVDEIEQTWEWRKNPLGDPAERLDQFVRLRGSIAHGEQLQDSVKKSHVTKARDLLSRLVGKVEARLVAEGLLA